MKFDFGELAQARVDPKSGSWRGHVLLDFYRKSVAFGCSACGTSHVFDSPISTARFRSRRDNIASFRCLARLDRFLVRCTLSIVAQHYNHGKL